MHLHQRCWCYSGGIGATGHKTQSLQNFKSFRLRVKRAQLDRVEDGEFWPEGVIVSPFFRPRIVEQQGVVSGRPAPPNQP